ncbi:unnamed protein product [Orchesella dallaii]|uniref:Uncharacterized protein n=1 Tax=Orchesella dallaii TaxID=48710 RepID=A0ABP1QY49_9HEXA
MSNVKAKISPSKVAKKLSSLANTKGAKGLTKAKGLLSKYFLAKSIVNGIMHGDKASLTMLGVRIGDSVDIGVTAAVASFALPPAAPLFIAVGVVIDVLNKLVTSMFKAANEVDRINAEIPLLVSEKRMVFTSRFFDWFGTREKDYLEFLVEEKKAKDRAVSHSLRFLQENIAFRGIVFPSRTMSYDGSCRLRKRRCKVENAWGCTTWDYGFKTVGSGCERNKPCGGYSSSTDYWEREGAWAYVDFKCVCDSNSKTEFDYPRSDQTVDFRNMKSLYWERAVPNDVEGAEFKCKPGSLTFQDYQVYQENSRFEYLCQNAIALVQPWSRWREGQIMLFDLEDGNDVVYINKENATPNLFRVGNGGVKSFHGGKGKNEFLLSGTCTSELKVSLVGGASEFDTVTITDYGELWKRKLFDAIFSV